MKCSLKALLIASGSEISLPFTTILGILIELFALDRMLLIPFQYWGKGNRMTFLPYILSRIVDSRVGELCVHFKYYLKHA